MSREEILSLSPEALFARVRAKLFPWDESRCRVCGWKFAESQQWWFVDIDRGERGVEDVSCTPAKCCEINRGDVRAEFLPDLSGWSGVGLMVEAMEAKGYRWLVKRWRDGYFAEFWRTDQSEGYADRVDVAVARAVLLSVGASCSP